MSDLAKLSQQALVRMARRRERLREQGLKPWQVWLPDWQHPAQAENAHAQAEALFAHSEAIWPGPAASRGDIVALNDLPDAAFALVLQAEAFAALGTRLVVPIMAAGPLAPALRLPLPAQAPRAVRGQVLALDRLRWVERTSIAETVGRLDRPTLRQIDAALVSLLGAA